jgi:hypothetical protein
MSSYGMTSSIMTMERRVPLGTLESLRCLGKGTL